MSESSSFSEAEQRDQHCLAATRLLIAHHTVRSHLTREHAKKLQDRLILQLQRLRNQQRHLVALEEPLKVQVQKVFQSSSPLEPS